MIMLNLIKLIDTDYNDAMDLLNNHKQNVLKEREQRYNHQHD